MALPNPHAVPVVSISTAGELLGVSRATAYRAAAAGTLPIVIVAGTRWVPTAILYELLALPVPAAAPAPPAVVRPVVDHS